MSDVTLSDFIVFRGTKRRREVEDNISINEEIERLLNTPKKKKLQTTSQYIYENLFIVSSSLSSRNLHENVLGW